METKIKLGGQMRSLQMHDAGDAPRSAKNEPTESSDASAPVGVTRVSEHQLRLTFQDRVMNLHVVGDAEGLWVWHEGRARFRKSEVATKRAARRSPRGPTGGDIVTPPMPATVVRILCEVDQQVSAGDGLVLVSAMKMETTLRAPVGGVVKAIHTNEGSTVKPGDNLVDIEPAETSEA